MRYSTLPSVIPYKYKSRYSRPPKVTVFCNICGKLRAETPDGVLVRDHNHALGYIRGILCHDCNNKLGIYESKKGTAKRIIKARKKKIYINWLTRYFNRIQYHLSCNTGYMFHSECYKYIPLEVLVW